jgi:death-on-curing protein
MIDSRTARQIHDILIDRFGGSKGIRDDRGLESALARPFGTFDGKDLYSTPVEKAAALFESLIISHPFVDGNKRISYVLMRLLLLTFGHDIEASQDDKYEFVLSASKGEIRFEQIRDWLSRHLRTKNEP